MKKASFAILSLMGFTGVVKAGSREIRGPAWERLTLEDGTWGRQNLENRAWERPIPEDGIWEDQIFEDGPWRRQVLRKWGVHMPFRVGNEVGDISLKFGRKILLELFAGESRISTFPRSRIMIGEQFEESRSKHITNYDGHEYTTQICIGKDESGSLTITATVEQRIFSRGRVEVVQLNLAYRNGQWVDASTGEHDPRYVALTEGYTVIHVKKGGPNESWHASEKEGFVPSENKVGA